MVLKGFGLGNVLLALVVGGLCVVALALTFGNDGGVRDAVAVRNSDVDGAPEASGDAAGSPKTMVASYYGYSLAGSPTASGEPFDPEGYTAAHKGLPLGTDLRVTYSGESVRVVVNDRGPYSAGRDLDLSLAAAREIGLTGPGEAPVRVVVL